MRLTRLLACLPVWAIVVATGCADGPLEGVRPVKYVKIEDANATTTREPPPKQPTTARTGPLIEEKPSTATTSAASSSTESVEPAELLAAGSGAGKKPGGKAGKPPKPIGGGSGTPKPAASDAKPPEGGPPTPQGEKLEKCVRTGKEKDTNKDCCFSDGNVERPPNATSCPRGTVLVSTCKKKCK